MRAQSTERTGGSVLCLCSKVAVVALVGWGWMDGVSTVPGMVWRRPTSRIGQRPNKYPVPFICKK
jgi:hypothetical protein